MRILPLPTMNTHSVIPNEQKCITRPRCLLHSSPCTVSDKLNNSHKRARCWWIWPLISKLTMQSRLRINQHRMMWHMDCPCFQTGFDFSSCFLSYCVWRFMYLLVIITNGLSKIVILNSLSMLKFPISKAISKSAVIDFDSWYFFYSCCIDCKRSLTI